ncbi:DUF1127 domain-containing protein [Rhizobium leguminosarum]|uniref:DUF1127 domain-containing protein n=1 Tax=Rhizobium leguminosarum TaxID=384 RepID=UPI0004881CD8|nr:DUF1127 domain-containing protein [Rhizobium leguminosarum]
MAHTETHGGTSAPKGQLFESRPNSVAIIVAALRTWRRSVARRKALADLTPDQLRDIGHPQDNRPVLEIKAGLMTKLMSMR